MEVTETSKEIFLIYGVSTMHENVNDEVEKRVVSPEQVFEKITPGMNIFIGTGVAEPRTLVKRLMSQDAGNLQDLELSQLVSLGDAISTREHHSNKYRLKTFFSGWEANEAISAGLADFIPSRYYQIPRLNESGQIRQQKQ